MKASPILTALSALVFGFFIGISFPVEITPKLQCGIFPCSGGGTNSSFSDNNIRPKFWAPFRNSTVQETPIQSNGTSGIQVPTNPKGAEMLPPGIVVSESDLHLRRLWGAPSEDGPTRKYLLTIPVGYSEKANVNATVQKFSDNFDVLLFHYDGRTTEWNEFEWSKQAVHVSARKQSKWWFAKRFLHPSIVAPYEYIFLWDEDFVADNFTAEEYISIAKKHGLEISQPGLDITRGKKTYDVTIRRNGSEMHKFVEVMVPVFTRDAWRCVWHMIQNDLVHGWGLDYNFWRCVHDPEEQIGVVDAQYGVHRGVPTLVTQGDGEKQASSEKVRDREWAEMRTFYARLAKADKDIANATAAAAAAAAAADHRS